MACLICFGNYQWDCTLILPVCYFIPSHWLEVLLLISPLLLSESAPQEWVHSRGRVPPTLHYYSFITFSFRHFITKVSSHEAGKTLLSLSHVNLYMCNSCRNITQRHERGDSFWEWLFGIGGKFYDFHISIICGTISEEIHLVTEK